MEGVTKPESSTSAVSCSGPVVRQIEIPTAALVQRAIDEAVLHGRTWPVEWTQELRKRLKEELVCLPDGTLAGLAHGFVNGILIGMICSMFQRQAHEENVRQRIHA